MLHTVKIAGVQMRSFNGEVGTNLQKAESLVTQAAQAGAQLVVLPELFNTGYEYTAANYRLAEPPDGPTYTWLRETATRLNVHLAGTFLLRKREEIFNTLVLVAPSGRAWEYDKLHPWGWERAYFRPGDGPVVADTDLGQLGLMICWDVAYPDLFRAYAGRVQMLVISSCPPAMGHMEIHLPNGQRLSLADTSPLGRAIRDRSDAVMDEDLRAQGAWLGVPLVNAMQHGRFTSPVPRPALSLVLALLPNPRLWPLVRHAAGATISAPHNEHTLVADATGHVLARPGAGDAFALAEVRIPDSPPRPTLPQPKMQLHPAAYLLHNALNWLSKPEYDRHAKDPIRSQERPPSMRGSTDAPG